MSQPRGVAHAEPRPRRPVAGDALTGRGGRAGGGPGRPPEKAVGKQAWPEMAPPAPLAEKLSGWRGGREGPPRPQSHGPAVSGMQSSAWRYPRSHLSAETVPHYAGRAWG